MAELIKDLCTLNGVSGNEDAARKYVLTAIADKADEITVDTIGNVIALKKGKSSDYKIMIISNIDEIGFIVSGITDKGYLKVEAVGRFDDRNIISKKVTVGNGVKGIIGMKAIHLQERKERESTVSVSDLFIDIGAKSEKEAKKLVSLGDYVAFDSPYIETENRISAKALDRVGSACLIEAMDEPCEYDAYFVFSTQREVSARGAKISAHRIQPDIALAVGTVESADMYGVKSDKRCAVLGGGAVINTANQTSLKNATVTEFLKEITQKSNVKIGEYHGFSGTPVSGAVQSYAPAAVAEIDIPCRYSHTPVVMADKRDIASATEAIKLFIREIGGAANGIVK